MKRTLGMGMSVKPAKHTAIKPPKIDGHSTTSTLNGDESDKGIEQDGNENITLKDAEMCAREAPFEDRFSILSKPFQYISLLVNTREIDGFLKKNITNNIWATGLAEEIQHILICEIKHKNPAVRTRDDIIVSSTKYMAQIFEQILNLFETNDYDAKYDIEGLFELLIENIYRLEGTVTPTFQESISFDDTRKILRNYKNWVIELRLKFFNIA